MPFNPQPSNWIPGLTVTTNTAALPAEEIRLIADDGTVWVVTINSDGLLEQTPDSQTGE